MYKYLQFTKNATLQRIATCINIRSISILLYEPSLIQLLIQGLKIPKIEIFLQDDYKCRFYYHIFTFKNQFNRIIIIYNMYL